MKRRSLVFAATIGCALPSFASENVLTPVQEYSIKTKTEKDEFNGNTHFNLKFDISSNDTIEQSVGSLLSVYTVNKEEIADRHGIILVVKYKSNSELGFDDAYDSDKNKLYIESLKTDRSILRTQGRLSETLFVLLNWDYLFDHAETGMKIRVYAKKGGRFDVIVSSDQIKGFLSRQWGEAVRFNVVRRIGDLTYTPNPNLEKQLDIIGKYK